jgi:hypothetical protein
MKNRLEKKQKIENATIMTNHDKPLLQIYLSLQDANTTAPQISMLTIFA